MAVLISAMVTVAKTVTKMAAKMTEPTVAWTSADVTATSPKRASAKVTAASKVAAAPEMPTPPVTSAMRLRHYCLRRKKNAREQAGDHQGKFLRHDFSP